MIFAVLGLVQVSGLYTSIGLAYFVVFSHRPYTPQLLKIFTVKNWPHRESDTRACDSASAHHLWGWFCNCLESKAKLLQLLLFLSLNLYIACKKVATSRKCMLLFYRHSMELPNVFFDLLEVWSNPMAQQLNLSDSHILLAYWNLNRFTVTIYLPKFPSVFCNDFLYCAFISRCGVRKIGLKLRKIAAANDTLHAKCIICQRWYADTLHAKCIICQYVQY